MTVINIFYILTTTTHCTYRRVIYKLKEAILPYYVVLVLVVFTVKHFIGFVSSSCQCPYGSLPTHDGLWRDAEKTSHRFSSAYLHSCIHSVPCSSLRYATYYIMMVVTWCCKEQNTIVL